MERDAVKQAFIEYTSRFDSSILMVRNKILHTWHVASNSEEIAERLQLSKQEIDLAWIIGILHDIGRFEQISKTHSYTDSEALDHADLGVKLLQSDKVFTSLGIIQEDMEMIKTAIRYHNKLDLPVNLSIEEFLFSNIVRDADKIDNFRGFVESDFVSFHERTWDEVQNSDISDEVMQCIYEHRTIPHGIIATAADFFLLPYALYFGLAFDCSRSIAEEQGYYSQMLEFEFLRERNRSCMTAIRREVGSITK